jgi:trehalose monomycolate/heme transporter
MLAALSDRLYRARLFVLFFALAIVCAAAWYGLGVFPALKSQGFQDPQAQSTKAYNMFVDGQLSNSSTDAVVLLQSDSLTATQPQFQQSATDLINQLKSRSEVAAVTSYYSTHSPSFISNDGHETFLALQLTGPDKNAQWSTLKPLMKAQDLHVITGGNLEVGAEINNQIGSDLSRAETLTFPILAVLLIIVFGGLVAASMPLLIGGVAIFGAFALLRLLTHVTDVSVYAINVVTLIGLGLAIDYALFIVTRFREELAKDEQNVQGALRRTMQTAGRTVFFSGLTVSTSLLGLLLFPEYFLRSLGLGSIGAVLAAMMCALLILPPLLGLLGPRVNALSIRRLFRRSSQRSSIDTGEHGAWHRISLVVMRYPIIVLVLIGAFLLFLGSPFLHVQFSSPDIRTLPADAEGRVTSERLQQDFPQQGASQDSIAIKMTGDATNANNLAKLESYVGEIQAIPHVVGLTSLVTIDPRLTLTDYQQIYSSPGVNPQIASYAARLANGNATVVSVSVDVADHSDAAKSVVQKIRAITPPDGFTPYVGGETAYQIDLFANLNAILPFAALTIILSTFVLFFLMTGSLVIPLKAILLVFIFQQGHLSQLLHFVSVGSLDSTQPILIFAIAFGLSMDYEVFLLSRIKEQYDVTRDNTRSVAIGLQRTGWLITSAAVLLAVVVGAFATSKVIFIQEIGVGLALAVVMDATLVRALLVPATMQLLGDWNWWAPRPLQSIWGRVGLREETEVQPQVMLTSEE